MAIQAQAIIFIFKYSSSLALLIYDFLIEMSVVIAMNGPSVPTVWPRFHQVNFLLFFLLFSLFLLTTFESKRTLIFAFQLSARWRYFHPTLLSHSINAVSILMSVIATDDLKFIYIFLMLFQILIDGFECCVITCYHILR